MEQESAKKWYDNGIVVHVLLFFCFPIGLYALWKSSTIPQWWKITASFIIASVFFMNILSGIVSNSDNSSSRSPAYKISARQLYAEYEQNEVGADNKYRNRIVDITGTVDDISRTIIGDQISVILDRHGIIGSVQCYFPETEAGQIGQLSRGSRVTVRGVVTGKMMAVQVEDCVLLAY